MSREEPKDWYQAHPSIGLRKLEGGPWALRPFVPPPPWQSIPDEHAARAEEEFFASLARFLHALAEHVNFTAELPIPGELERLQSLVGNEALTECGGRRVRGPLCDAVMTGLLHSNPVRLTLSVNGEERFRLNDGWEDVVVALTADEADQLADLLGAADSPP